MDKVRIYARTNDMAGIQFCVELYCEPWKAHELFKLLYPMAAYEWSEVICG